MQKLRNLDILAWNYKSQADEITHIGPVAQDFYATFNVGNDSTSISSIDPAGIALAAIKEMSRTQDELNEKVRELEQVNSKVEAMESQIAELSQLVELLLAENNNLGTSQSLSIKEGE